MDIEFPPIVVEAIKSRLSPRANEIFAEVKRISGRSDSEIIRQVLKMTELPMPVGHA